jgi:hypothetical protein
MGLVQAGEQQSSAPVNTRNAERSLQTLTQWLSFEVEDALAADEVSLWKQLREARVTDRQRQPDEGVETILTRMVLRLLFDLAYRREPEFPGPIQENLTVILHHLGYGGINRD